MVVLFGMKSKKASDQGVQHEATDYHYEGFFPNDADGESSRGNENAIVNDDSGGIEMEGAYAGICALDMDLEGIHAVHAASGDGAPPPPATPTSRGPQLPASSQ